MRISKKSRACDISPAVRKEVLERDDCRCIVCGIKHNLQIAHYVSRARNGLGIPENLVTLCYKHHYLYDNGKFHTEIKKCIEDYLKTQYPEWDEAKLIYRKEKTL